MRLRRAGFVCLLILAVFFWSKNKFVSASNSWIQTDWSGGSSQSSWSDNTKYYSASNINDFSGQLTLSPNSNWFNSSWKYRSSVGVTNSSGSTLTDYQIPIIINTASLISASKMNSDCSDLRVTDSVGSTLPFWISTSPATAKCNQTATKVWVKASSLSTSGTTFHLYYGNSSAPSQSNGDNVFPIFADFTIGTSLPTNWIKKDIGTSGTYSIGGSLALSNTNGEDLWNNIYGASHIYKNTQISGSFIAEALITSQSNSNEWGKSGISVQNSVAASGGNGHAFIVTTPNNGTPFQYQSLTGELCTAGSCPTVVAPNVNLNSVNPTTLTFPILLKLTKDNSNQISGYVSSNNGSTWTQKGGAVAPWGVSSSQYVSLFLTPHSTTATGTATYTFFYTRKFSATEPNISSPSNEQNIYLNSGSLISSVFNTGYPSIFGNINYNSSIPVNTTLNVKIRTSNNADMSGAIDFSLCNNISSSVDISSNNCVTDGHRYIQYQITFNTSDSTITPSLQDLSIEYSPPSYTVTFLAGSNGLISGTSPQIIEYGNDTSQVTAVPNSGYHFINWSDGNTQNPRQILMVTANKSITANFAADDADSPVISAETATPSSDSAVITWTTNENSSSLVQYGLHQSYGFITSETDTSPRVLSHTVSLSNLKPCARYYYRVVSSDSVDNQSASAQKTFSTSGCPVSTIIVGTETTLPVTGGTLQITNNLSTAQINVPNNYSDQTATFQINKLDVSPVSNTPEGKSIATNNFYDLIAVTENNQQLNTFDSPVTFTISYSSDTENGFDESTLDVYKYDGSSWIKKNCTLDTNANTLTCNLNGFSSYALLGNPKNNSSPSTSSNSSSSSSPNNSICNDSRPVSFPDLFQINTTLNSAKIFFTPLSDTNHYYISFSTKPIAEEFSADVTLAREGVQNFTINLLKPNTIYYLKVRGQIGCMPGGWSNIMKIQTNSQIFYKNFSPSTNLSSNLITKTSSKTPTPESTPAINQPPKTTTKPKQSVESAKKCFLWWCWGK
ncbi:MAG: DUF2341 domain-containing protein [Candidatus Shapirobacteria bacterium]|nr:DUF2341 domain-containing protein [Candidatus Shapirobacteria bacterium]